jgi:hypothetical protein
MSTVDPEAFAAEHVRRFGDVYILDQLRSDLRAKYTRVVQDPPPWERLADPKFLTPARLQAQVERAFPGRGATSDIDFAASPIVINVSVPPHSAAA